MLDYEDLLVIDSPLIVLRRLLGMSWNWASAKGKFILEEAVACKWFNSAESLNENIVALLMMLEQHGNQWDQ